jgi:hypothetical protein
MVSRARFDLAIFGSSLTESQASASLSDIVPAASTISGEGTIKSLVKITLETAGTGGGISSTPLSVVGPSVLNVKAGVCVGWDGLEGSVIDDLFAFQGRRMVDINSLACRPHLMGMLQSLEVLFLASVVPECAGVGWLDLRNELAKGMAKRCT